MGLYIQHGYGKSDKIDTAINEDIVKGIILSPRDEKIDKMEELVAKLLAIDKPISILFDPQFYASTVIPLNAGRLIDYPYFHENLTRKEFSMPSNIKQFVTSTLDYQRRLMLSTLVSPTVLVDDFNGPWSQIALGLAYETVENIKSGEKIFISLCIDQEALRNGEALDEYLDMLSTLNVDGFYLTVKNELGSNVEGVILEKMIYLCYSLANVNEYKVIVGYSDLLGVPLFITEIEGVGSGWFNGMNAFSLKRFMPSTGGRRPRPRYTTKALLNKILVNPELQAIYELREMDLVYCDSGYDAKLKNNPVRGQWSAKEICMHNWVVLNEIISSIVEQGAISERIEYVLEIIDEAIAVYIELEDVPFEGVSGKNHLYKWRNAITSFCESEGV